MIRRLLRTVLVLTLIAGVIGATVAVARKLMGGLGPEPGSSTAPVERPSLVPVERPSLVPEPPAPEASSVGGPSGNGAAASAAAEL